MRFKVPGNILLFGEYAITLKRGLGIAFAIDRFVYFEIEKASTLQILSNQDNRLVHHIASYFQIPFKVHIDSSEFFLDGKKRGFGSSAAVTVGLIYGLLTLILKREPDLQKEVFPLAVTLHRSFQGGRGSGYDVAVATFGGLGIFEGGVIPQWTPISFLLPPFSLVQGDAPVSSSQAVEKFETLKEKEKSLHVSNKLVFSYLKKRSPFFLNVGIFLHRWIHEKLHIPYNCPYFSYLREKGCLVKPVGAGNELAFVSLMNSSIVLEPFKMVFEGVSLLP